MNLMERADGPGECCCMDLDGLMVGILVRFLYSLCDVSLGGPFIYTVSL